MSEELRSGLRKLLNANNAEAGSNTPDFILAEFLYDVMELYNKAVKARSAWYGREDAPGKQWVSVEESNAKALKSGPPEMAAEYRTETRSILEIRLEELETVRKNLEREMGLLKEDAASARDEARAAWKRRSEWQESELARMRAEYDQRFADLHDKFVAAEKEATLKLVEAAQHIDLLEKTLMLLPGMDNPRSPQDVMDVVARVTRAEVQVDKYKAALKDIIRIAYPGSQTASLAKEALES